MNTGVIDPLSKLPYVPGATYDAQRYNHGCLENTRVDILADLDRWAQDQKVQSIYWLAGMAGTGKSTIAWSFCERLVARNLLGGSFFVSRTGPASHSDMARVIPTLARLLALAHSGFRSELIKQLEGDPDAADKSIGRQIEVLLRKPLAHPSRYWSDRPDILVIIIDALDECSDRDATTEMLHALIKSSSFLHPLKFFVTSRPEHHIRGTPLSDHNLSHIVKLHEIKPSTVDADIRLFVQDSLSTVQNLRYTRWHVMRLTELSNGLFIFASTAISYIRGGNSTERLRKVISSAVEPGGPMTKPLDNMYQVILEETLTPGVLESNELAFLKQILSCILSMPKSLSICDLAEFLGVPPDQLRGHLDLLHSVISIPDDNTSPGIKTLHASFGDFLTERAPNHMRFDKSARHQHLLHACLRRMSDDDLCFNISKTPSSYFRHPNPGSIVADISENLQYACLHWPRHLSFVATPSHFIPDIEQVFCSKFLFWLELLGLLGRVDEALSLISAVIETINSPSLEISHFLRDAIAFIESSREVIELRAPHIYLSILASTPSSSLIFKRFYRRFKQLPVVKPEGIIGAIEARLHYNHCVNSLAFSPKGTHIVSGSDDNTIQVWDAHTEAELMSPLPGHDSWVNSVAFSLDGTHIVSSSDDNTIRVWDAHTGAELLSPLIGHRGWVNSVAFSPDGTRIVSGSGDNTIRVWDAHTGAELLLPLIGHRGWVNSVAFSPDGTRIITGSSDSTIQVWDARTGAGLLSSLIGHDGWVNSVAFSPDGMRIVSGSDDKTVRIWDARTGAELISPLIGHDGSIKSVAFSPDGMRIVSGSGDSTIRIWDAHTGKGLLSLLIGHYGWIVSLAFSPDGAHIASGSQDGTIRVWDAHAGAELEPSLFSIINPIIHSCLFSHDRKWIKGQSEEHLFWIPPEYRRHRIHIQILPCTLLIDKYCVIVDFTACELAHGTNWTQCFVG